MCGIYMWNKKYKKKNLLKRKKEDFYRQFLVIKKVNEINDSLALKTPDSDWRINEINELALR